MSHFQKALERARSVTAGKGLNLPEEAPSADMFETPWGIEEPLERPEQLGQGASPEQPAAKAVTPRVAGAPAPAPTLRIHPDVFDKVVAHSDVSPIVVEQYRMLAASLHRWQGATGGKVVLVAGTAARDGATLTTVNLAITLTGAYRRRVLLVDCDLREHGLHTALMASGSRRPGASSGVPPAPVAVGPRLSVVAAGLATRDPARTLPASTITLLERGREAFDWVLVDVDAGSDMRLLAPHVDGTVLVVAAGKTGRAAAEEVITALGRDRVLGVVLNGIHPRDMPDRAAL